MGTLRAMVARHEGRRNRPYVCPARHLTIGVGWNLDAWPLPPDVASYLRIHGRITDEMIDRLLDIQLEAAVRDCRDLFPGFDGFTEARRNALADMCFNLGAGGLAKFKRMRRAIEAGDWGEAAEQVRDSSYWRQLGGDPVGEDDGKLERPEEIAAMLREG